MADKAPLPVLDDFPVKARDTIRYGDTDMLGHVNNAVFSTFLETGRTHLLLTPRRLAPQGMGFALVRLVLDYRAEMHWPGEADIGTGVISLGRSSVGLRQAIFQDGQCMATAETVIVLFDLTERRATPLSDEMRAALEALRIA